MSSTMSSSNLELDSIAFIPELDETPMSLEEILSIDFSKQDDKFPVEIYDDDFNIDFIVSNDDNNMHHLSVIELPFVKTQISNAKQTIIGSGNPTCITCSKNLLAVGTFYGHILIFDTQRIKMFLKHQSDFGTISAMTINAEENRLLCGGGKGSVSLWNIESGEILRVVDNIHASFSSIIGLRYTSDINYAVLADTSGSVFFLDTRKKDFESNCVFTGSRGEVLAIQPLILHKKEEKDVFFGIEPVCMVAMATVSKVIVVSLRPNLFVHFTFPLKGDAEFLPILAWNFTFKLVKPHLLLMFGREDQIFIYHVDTSCEDKINFQPFYQFQTPGYFLQNLFWIEEDTILLLDTKEKCHLVDFGDEIETIDISHVELVYERANYKSLINGGFVSKAMAKAGEHASINSITLRHTPSRIVLYFLGVKSVYEVKLQTWQERTNFFIQSGNPLRALEVANDELTYIDSNDHQRKINEKSRNEVLFMLEQSLESFENIAYKNGISKSKDLTKIRIVLKIILKYIFILSNKEEKVYELFEIFDQTSPGRQCLIECLEEYIFSNKLSNLNPILIKEIINHYLSKDWIDLLDAIITKFEIINLDLNYLMNICLDKCLYDTYLYVNNVAFHDYITPFNELLAILGSRIENNNHFNKSDILLGNKLLVYLCSMLTCSNYPNKGLIDHEDESEHLDKIYDRMMFCNSNGESDVLNVLFRFDPVEFLNSILIAFEFVHDKYPQSQWKQNLIDFYIVRVLIKDDKFDSEQRNAFFIFLARCLVTFKNVEMSKNHFLILVNSLFTNRTVKKFDERQQILIQLFSHSFRIQFYPEQDFLNHAYDCEMFRICDFIHRKNLNWNELFMVYLLDEEKKDEIFDYIHSVFSNENLPNNSRRFFVEAVFENYLLLIKIDSLKAANLFFSHYDGNEEFYEKLLNNLNSDRKCLFEFLNFTIYHQKKKSLKSSDEMSKANIKLCTNAKYQELSIDLACEIGSKNLISYIPLYSEADKHKALESCQKYSMKEGEALIFEILKKHSKSFDILFDHLKLSVTEMIEYYFNNLDIDNWKNSLDFDLIKQRFDVLLNFCVRCFKNFIPKTQNFCLETLEYLIEINTNLNKIQNLKIDKLDKSFKIYNLEKNSQNQEFQINFAKILNKNFHNIFEQLLNTMINWMDSREFFDVIRNQILQQNENFMDLKEILLCILENYHYESNLLQLTRSILSHEQYGLIKRFHNSNVRSCLITNSLCNICQNFVMKMDFNSETNNIIVYGCKHVFHRKCYEEQFSQDSQNGRSSICPLCNCSSLDE